MGPGLGLPNGLELSCPAEAGNPSPLYGTPAGQASQHRGPSPPGQLQRVVRPPNHIQCRTACRSHSEVMGRLTQATTAPIAKSRG